VPRLCDWPLWAGRSQTVSSELRARRKVTRCGRAFESGAAPSHRTPIKLDVLCERRTDNYSAAVVRSDCPKDKADCLARAAVRSVQPADRGFAERADDLLARPQGACSMQRAQRGHALRARLPGCRRAARRRNPPKQPSRNPSEDERISILRTPGDRSIAPNKAATGQA